MVFPNHPLPPSPETQSSGHDPLTAATRSSPQTVKSRRYRSRRRGYEVVLGTLGAIGGGGLGWATAGVEGLVVGIVLGAVVGALAAWAVQGQERESADRNSQLDAEIGVDGGDIGAPNLEHPPSRSPHPSRESSGVGGVAGSSPASGPFLKPPS